MVDPDLINLENLYKTEIKPQIQAQNQIQEPKMCEKDVPITQEKRDDI